MFWKTLGLCCAVFSLSACTFSLPSSQPPSSSSSSSPSLSSSSEGTSASSSKETSSSSASSAAGDVALSNSEEYLKAWDLATRVSVTLSFSNASIYALSYYGANDNQKWGDVYFPADMTVDAGDKSYSFDEVGVRMKGNTSRREIALPDGTIVAPCHFKVSFKATFDDAIYDQYPQFTPFKHDWSKESDGDVKRTARKNRTWLDMEKMDLKYLPRNSDRTTSQEVFCYRKFNEAGIPAPRAKWASITLKSGVSERAFYYEMVEDIDKVFLKRHFSKSEAKGDLYKCVWGEYDNQWTGANLAREGAVSKTYDGSGFSVGTRVPQGRIGVEDNLAYYHPNYQLKTNDDGENSDFSLMATYINGLWNLRYQKADSSLLSSLLDVDEFLKAEAISYLFGNFDDQRNNANNYFLYFLPSTKKAIYLPYDWDWSLGAVDPSMSLDMAAFTPFQNTGIDGVIQTNVYYDTILSGAGLSYSLQTMRTRYLGFIKEYGIQKDFLSFAAYQSLVSHAPDSSLRSELSQVEAYFLQKRVTVETALA